MALLYQLDASRPATIWADDSKTTPASNGGVVAVWSPYAGSIATDAKQTSNSLRPIYRSNYSSTGYPGIQFDASNDILAIATSSGWAVSSISLLSVITVIGTAGIGPVFNKWNPSGLGSGWGLAVYNGRTASGIPTWNGYQTPIGNTKQIIFVRGNTTGKDGGSAAYYAGSSDTSSIPSNAYDVGVGGNTGGYYFNGVIHEVLAYDTFLTPQEFRDTLYSLDQKWGVGYFSAVSSGGIMSARGFNGGIAG